MKVPRATGEPRDFTRRTSLKLGLCAGAAMSPFVHAASAFARQAAAGPAPEQAGPEPSVTALEAGFQAPPLSARPRLWWHWMNGNVTRDGIEKDLAWMARIGAGGVQNFIANTPIPPVVGDRPAFMSDSWKETLRFAVRRADELGLDYTVPTSVGWSATGGTWVPPADGMKKLVFSDTIVEGDRRVVQPLPRLPTVTGPYQSTPLSGGPAELAHGGPAAVAGGQTIVLAVPEPEGEAVVPVLRAGGVALAADLKNVQVPVGPIGDPGFLDIAFAEPVTLRSIAIFMPGAALPGIGDLVRARLEVADGATGWRGVGDIPLFGVPTTVSFAAASGDRFRILLEKAPGPETLGYGSGDPGAVPSPYNAVARRPDKVRLVQLAFSTEARVHAFEAKAGFGTALDYHALSAADDDAATGADPSRVVDVTRFVQGDNLTWDAPPGRWRIVRLGWSLTGSTNHPGGEATGLEVDKYDRAAVRRYIETYIGQYKETLGDVLLGRRGLTALLHDSVEIGPSNWTPAILDHFRRLRGYDPRPWLPTLAGMLVGSRRESDGFLYDFRRTLADLIATEHYATIAEVAHGHGLAIYGEALERARPALGEDMAMRSHADIPSGAMWVYDRADGPQPAFIADVRGAASVANVLGRTLVGAESLTTFNEPWTRGPGDLKPVMDLAFVSGVNRPMIHASTHQPVDDKVPGLALGIFGQYLTRHETWAEMARPFFDYMSRCCQLLQQGRRIADIAYFYGEEAPLTALYVDRLPDVPPGFDYDFVNADLLIGHLRNDGREIVSSGGARYRAIALGGSSRLMTLPVMRKLADLVAGGATLIGRPPLRSPSLADDGAEVSALIARLWPTDGERRVGRGRVISTADLRAGVRAASIDPDIVLSDVGAPLLFTHRTVDDTDIYFVSNREDRTVDVNASFRVGRKAAEFWRPETGERAPAPYRSTEDRTTVTLRLAPDEAVFVVFRPARRRQRTAEAAPFTRLRDVQGPWRVAFQPGRGAPAALELAALAPLNERSEAGVKHFSGLATYTTDFDLPGGLPPGAPLILDLGRVGAVAEVTLNGRPVGIAWRAPFQLDVGSAVQPGRNRLQIVVATLWRNRLIGDAQPGARRKVTYTSAPTYRPDASLIPSGLIGPVTLMTRLR